MKVLVTGGCGFLGSNVAASFLADGAEVVIVDALLRRGGEENLQWLEGMAQPKQLHFRRVDLADLHALQGVFAACSPFDYICHLGGQVAMTDSLADPRRDLLSNVVGTFNVLECMRHDSPDAFLAYSSTNKVYGDLQWIHHVEQERRFAVPEYPDGFDESLPLDFASPYGCSKGAADQYVRDWHRNFDLKTVVFRHSSIYGGRQFSTHDQGWVGWFCQKALEQKRGRESGEAVQPFTISGTGKQVRDVLHGDDLVRLYRAAYGHRESCAGEIFNIGGGLANSLSLIELFGLLEDELGLTAPLEFTRLCRRQSDQDFFVADIGKAAARLGWKPRVSTAEGLRRMLDWAATCALPSRSS